MPKSTLVLGASPHPFRFAHRAIKRLRHFQHPVEALGLHKGQIEDVSIQTDRTLISTDIHTVSIYLNRYNQTMYYDWIISLKPKRVIFNPGAENFEFESKLNNAGIEVLNACTLVMLSIGNY